MPCYANNNFVGVCGIDFDFSDMMRICQTDVLPRCPFVRRFENANPCIGRARGVVFACANINRMCGPVYCNVSDILGGTIVHYRLKGRAVVGSVPQSA